MKLVSKQIEIEQVVREYDGFFKIDQVTFRHSLFQGGWTPNIKREIFGRGQAVVVLLYDPVHEMIAMVEQCRAGALTNFPFSVDNAWLIEPVAGMIEPGETKETACQREVLEEAGVYADEFEYICEFYPSPGASSEVLYLYATKVDVPSLPDYSGVEEDIEDIRVVKMSFEEAKTKLRAAEFTVASSIISLQWLFFQKGVG